MNTMVAFLLLIFVCPFSANALAAQAAPASSGYDFDQIRLVRTTCFGTCPAYSITISGNGRVLYNGYGFVRQKGRARLQLTQVQLRDLRLALEQADFFSLRDSYTSLADGCPRTATDNPSAITTVSMHGKTKTITHDLSCREADKNDPFGGALYPRPLAVFEDRIDQITNSKQWVEQLSQNEK